MRGFPSPDVEELKSPVSGLPHALKRGRHGLELTIQFLLVLALLGAPFYLGSLYNLRVATLICMYGAMALGWNLIGGFGGQISLGHGVFFGVGAYTTALLAVREGLSPLAGIPAGTALAVGLALVIGAPTFRLSGHYFALATIALLEIARIIAIVWADLTRGTIGLGLPIPTGDWVHLSFREPIWYFYLSAVLLLATLAISRLVWHSRLGYALRAIKQNPEAAALAGIDIFRVKILAFALSAAITAVTGGFYVLFVRFIDPESAFSLTLSVNLVLFAIIGGVNSWWGPALGALLLVPLGQYASLTLTGRLAAAGQLLYGLLLIVAILWWPRGVAAWLSDRWRRLWPGVIG